MEDEGGRLRGMKFHKGFVKKVINPVSEVVGAVGIPVTKAVATVVAPEFAPVIGAFGTATDVIKKVKGGSLRPHNKLLIKGGAIEVERVAHHSDMRFRLKKGLAGTGVASGAEQPRRPTATLVKGHYDDALPPIVEDGELTDKGFERYYNPQDIKENNKRIARGLPPPIPPGGEDSDGDPDDDLPPLPKKKKDKKK